MLNSESDVKFDYIINPTFASKPKGQDFFSFSIAPLHNCQLDETRETPAVIHESQGTILLVEDDPIIQIVHTNLLDSLGFEVILADSGKSALSETRDYDLILMDIGLPVMSGIDVCKAMRNSQKFHVPIIAVTSQLEKRETCLKTGFDDFIEKPLNREKLIRILEHWLSEDASPIPSKPLNF